MLDNRYALLFIRGERPLLDEKYQILKHPSAALTADGKAVPYEHGGTSRAAASLTAPAIAKGEAPQERNPLPEAALYTDEELETLFDVKEEPSL